MWAAVYVGLVLALFVRFRDPEAPVRPVPEPEPGEPARLVIIHHALFYALLMLACPLEALVLGTGSGGRAAGAIAFAVGVVCCRWSAVALGDALSPLVRPRVGARLVTGGPYRFIRHPMYLGQILIALGAPATLGCRYAYAVSFAAAVVLFARIGMEEDALATTYGEFQTYRARSKRLLPFVF